MKRFRKILCVVDTDRDCAPLLERVVTLAGNNRAELAVIEVVRPVRVGIRPPRAGAAAVDLQAALAAEHRQRLEALLEPYRQRTAIRAEVRAGTPFLEVVREVARRSPLPINESTSVASQAWILHTQIAEELAADTDNDVIICDRSVLDNYVYMLLAAGPQGPLEPLVDHWMNTYDLLLHVPIIEAPSADGIRALDPAFQRAIDTRLLTELTRRELPVEYLDGGARDEWLDTAVAVVLDRLKPPQMQLL